jgi:hypothetical protein
VDEPAKILMSLPHQPGDPDRLVGLRRWFGDGFRVLAGDMATELDSRPPLNQDAIRSNRGFGEPGQVWCSVSRMLTSRSRRSGAFAYSQRNFDRLLRSWLAAPFFDVQIDVSRINEEGRPWWLSRVTMKAQRLEEDERYLQLETWFPRDRIGPNLLGWWRDVADRLNPTYGELSSAYYLRTRYESSHGLFAHDTVPEGHRVLRGYAWITLAGQQVGDKLGGVEGLRATGAFVRVEQLANGGYWLQATEDFEAYGVDAEARVYRGLGSVLPDVNGLAAEAASPPP